MSIILKKIYLNLKGAAFFVVEAIKMFLNGKN